MELLELQRRYYFSRRGAEWFVRTLERILILENSLRDLGLLPPNCCRNFMYRLLAQTDYLVQTVCDLIEVKGGIEPRYGQPPCFPFRPISADTTEGPTAFFVMYEAVLSAFFSEWDPTTGEAGAPAILSKIVRTKNIIVLPEKSSLEPMNTLAFLLPEKKRRRKSEWKGPMEMMFENTHADPLCFRGLLTELDYDFPENRREPVEGMNAEWHEIRETLSFSLTSMTMFIRTGFGIKQYLFDKPLDPAEYVEEEIAGWPKRRREMWRDDYDSAKVFIDFHAERNETEAADYYRQKRREISRQRRLLKKHLDFVLDYLRNNFAVESPRDWFDD